MSKSPWNDEEEEWRRRLSAAIRREDAGGCDDAEEEEEEEDGFVLHPLCRAGPLQMTVKSSTNTSPTTTTSSFQSAPPSPSTPEEDISTSSSSYSSGVFPLVPSLNVTTTSITTGLVKKRRSSSSPEDICREKIPHLLLKTSSGVVVPLSTRSQRAPALQLPASAAIRTAPPPGFANTFSVSSLPQDDTMESSEDDNYLRRPTTSTSAPASPLDHRQVRRVNRGGNGVVLPAVSSDLNFTAEIFWLKTQLSDHWSMKWLFQVLTF
ncbi:unnamed protein product [Caenorhabditis brenneri]